MNLPKAFVEYLEDLGYGDFGTNIYIGNVPVDAPNKCFWIVNNGGSPEPRNNTGEKIKNYILSVYYRSDDHEDVIDTIQELEEEINGKHCTQLTGYETIEMSCQSFQTDQDLDSEDREVSLIQVTITVYQS